MSAPATHRAPHPTHRAPHRRLLSWIFALSLITSLVATGALATSARAADPLPIGISLVHLYPDSARLSVVCPQDPPSNLFVQVDGVLASEQSFDCAGPSAPAQQVTVTFDRLTVNLKVGSRHDVDANVTELSSDTVTSSFPATLVEDNGSTPPALPSAPLITSGPGSDTSWNSLTVAWDPPTSPNGTIETYRWGWTTDCATADTQSWHGFFDADDPDLTQPMVLTNLSPNCRYTITDRAYNQNGGGAIASIQLDTTPKPPTPRRPRHVHAHPGNHRARVSWDPPIRVRGARVTMYVVHRFNSPHNHLTMPSLHHTTFRHLKNHRTYTFYVRALSANGAGPWSRIATARPHR